MVIIMKASLFSGLIEHIKKQMTNKTKVFCTPHNYTFHNKNCGGSSQGISFQFNNRDVRIETFTLYDYDDVKIMWGGSETLTISYYILTINQKSELINLINEFVKILKL